MILELDIPSGTKLQTPFGMSSSSQTATFLDVFALELPNGALPTDIFQVEYDNHIPGLLHRKDSPTSPSSGSSPGSVTKINSEFIFPSSHHLSHEFNNNYVPTNTPPLRTNELSAAPYSPTGPMTPSFMQMSSYDQFFHQFAQPPQQYLPPLPSQEKYDLVNPRTHNFSKPFPAARRQSKSKKLTPDTGLTLPCPEPGCDKVFNRQFNLKSHLKSHAVERSYMCELCPASFRRSHDLKRHQRSLHSSIKPFECGQCVKKFSRMDALKRHVSRVGSQCYQPGFNGRDHEEQEE